MLIMKATHYTVAYCMINKRRGSFDQVLPILSSQVLSLPLQSVILEVANFCAAIDTLIGQDARYPIAIILRLYVNVRLYSNIDASEVYCNIYNTGPAIFDYFDYLLFFSYRRMRQRAQQYGTYRCPVDRDVVE